MSSKSTLSAHTLDTHLFESLSSTSSSSSGSSSSSSLNSSTSSLQEETVEIAASQEEPLTPAELFSIACRVMEQAQQRELYNALLSEISEDEGGLNFYLETRNKWLLRQIKASHSKNESYFLTKLGISSSSNSSSSSSSSESSST